MVSLDQIDWKIITKLHRDGRISNVELADCVGLSPSPCLIRVRRLERAGFIAGYQAVIDVAKLSPVTYVFTEFSLNEKSRAYCTKFEVALKKFDHVVECHMMSGRCDFMVKFMVRSIDEYQVIIDRLVDMDVGIKNYASHVVMKSPFVRREIPVMELFEPSVA